MFDKVIHDIGETLLQITASIPMDGDRSPKHGLCDRADDASPQSLCILCICVYGIVLTDALVGVSSQSDTASTKLMPIL